MDLIHPEKKWILIEKHHKRLRKMWDSVVGERSLEDLWEFQGAVRQYEGLVEDYKQPYLLKRRTTDRDTGDRKEDFRRMKASPLWDVAMITAYMTYPVMDWLMEQIALPSFPVLCLDPRMQELGNVKPDVLDTAGDALAGKYLENHLTEMLTHHAGFWFRHYGSKAYRVSPSLQWMLENTQLRRFPASGLRLPFPVIYLTIPSKYQIYNEFTGWHRAEGLYIIEDVNTIPRCWRLILVSKPNDVSLDELDDAVYHWLVHLDDTLTVEEALQRSIDIVYEQVGSGGYDRTIVLKDGTHKTMTSVRPTQMSKAATAKHLETFELMKNTVLPLFKYCMNVVLYATLPDADAVLSDANPEYLALRRRAIAEKNKLKRKRLNLRAGEIGSHPRIVLGGSLVVSREDRQASDCSGEGTGRKHKVRSLVAGHWHHYWIGQKANKTKIQKWVAPYWKGPEAAPLTSKEHYLT